MPGQKSIYETFLVLGATPSSPSPPSLLELANVKLNSKYLISSIWPKLKQELVEKYITLGPVLFHII
jgi:hypothetical protein